MNITGKDFLLYLPAVNAFVVVEAVVHRKANALFIKRKTAAAKKKRGFVCLLSRCTVSKTSWNWHTQISSMFLLISQHVP